jgi:hypothetical protein
MRQLQLPPTIRTPRIDEVPNRKDVIDAINKRLTANIVEGYVIKDNPSGDLPFFAEINIDNDNLWELFKTLSLHIESEISVIFKHIDDETTYGIYGDRYESINILEEVKLELTQDGFLEFGVIYHDENKLEEVFVKRAKYIQYWGMKKENFVKIMEDFNLYPIQNFNFIDEYPLVTESLISINTSIKDTDYVLDYLNKSFVGE